MTPGRRPGDDVKATQLNARSGAGAGTTRARLRAVEDARPANAPASTPKGTSNPQPHQPLRPAKTFHDPDAAAFAPPLPSTSPKAAPLVDDVDSRALLEEPQAPPRTAAWMVGVLHRRALDVLGSLVPRHRHAVLLDFPHAGNAGDSAIWLGELALLRRLGVRLSHYSCHPHALEIDALRNAVGRGTILLHGGGTLGDLWPTHQAFRERVIAAFPNNRIVLLPQTMYFQTREALDRARAVFDKHRRLTLLLRDHESLSDARQVFAARSLLCPDMAFGLGPLARPTRPSADIVVLSRTDREIAQGAPIASGASLLSSPLRVELNDWLHEPSGSLRRMVGALDAMLHRHPRRAGLLARVRSPLSERLGRQQLQFGMRFLSRGRVVVTNRLHGHILCLLMDIPHVFLDNSYRKNRTFFECWTQACPVGRWCDEPQQALRMAQDLL